MAEEKSEERNCSICAEEFDYLSPVCQTACGHQYHQICLRRWLDSTTSNRRNGNISLPQTQNCPMCRSTNVAYSILQPSEDVLLSSSIDNIRQHYRRDPHIHLDKENPYANNEVLTVNDKILIQVRTNARIGTRKTNKNFENGRYYIFNNAGSPENIFYGKFENDSRRNLEKFNNVLVIVRREPINSIYNMYHLRQTNVGEESDTGFFDIDLERGDLVYTIV